MSPQAGKKRLLDFLRDLLANPSMNDIIVWTDKDNQEFRMIKPHAVASKWGAATSNFSMNYDKMSRGLRYFYTNGTMEKIKGKDSRYRFLEGGPSSPSSSTSSSPPQMPTNFQLTMASFGLQNGLIPSQIAGIQMTSTSTSSGPSNTFNMSRFLTSESNGKQISGNSSLHSSPSSSSSSPIPSDASSESAATSSGIGNGILPIQNSNQLAQLFYMYLAYPHLIPK